jgi:hypothetical protein
MERTMSTTAADLSNLLPTATQAREKLALAEAEKASEALRRKEKADAEKKALIDQLSKPNLIRIRSGLDGRLNDGDNSCTVPVVS